MIPCKWCGCFFQPNKFNPGQIYCSTRCNIKGQARKKRLGTNLTCKDSLGFCVYCMKPFKRKRFGHIYCSPICQNGNWLTFVSQETISRNLSKARERARRYRARHPERVKHQRKKHAQNKRQSYGIWKTFHPNYTRNYKRKSVAGLNDRYCLDLLRKGTTNLTFPAELIEAKRQQIKLIRTIK